MQVGDEEQSAETCEETTKSTLTRADVGDGPDKGRAGDVRILRQGEPMGPLGRAVAPIEAPAMLNWEMASGAVTPAGAYLHRPALSPVGLFGLCLSTLVVRTASSS